MQTLECHNSFINCMIHPLVYLFLRERPENEFKCVAGKVPTFYKSSVTDWFLIDFKDNQD